MPKGVAVPYVIALILGVAVIALIGIWFVTSGGKFGGQATTTSCDNKFGVYCITNPSKSYTDFTSGDTGKECAGIAGSFQTCSQVLGIRDSSGPLGGGGASLDEDCGGTTGKTCRTDDPKGPLTCHNGKCKGDTGYKCDPGTLVCAKRACAGSVVTGTCN